MANKGISYPFKSMYNVVFEGDSLTYGTQSSGYSKTYPFQLIVKSGALNIRPGMFVTNLAVAGDKMHDISLEAQYIVVDAMYNTSYNKNIVILWAGTNDLNSDIGYIYTTAYDKLIAWCTARKTIGFLVYVLTILPRTDDGVNGSFETRRLAFNTLLRDGGDFILIDIAADSRLNDSTDIRYFNGDRVHLNDTGYGIIADLVLAQL